MTYTRGDIHFYKSLDYIISLDITLGYPVYVPSEIRDDYGRAYDLALLAKEKNKWFMYSDLLTGGEENGNSGLRSNQSELGNREEIKIASGSPVMKEYYPPAEVDELLTSLSQLRGVLIQHEAVLKQYGFIIFIESVNETRDKAMDLVENYSGKIGMDVSLIEIDKNNDPEIPHCIKFLKENREIYDQLELVITRWKMRREEIRKDVAGIFQNQGAFRPKYFDSKSANIIANLTSDKILGDSGYTEFNKDSNEKAVEFEVSSFWFGDFFRDVIKRYMGSFYYWAYSDGRGSMENYFIINGNMKGEFLSGLMNHWKEPRRTSHHNSIKYIEKLKKII